MPTHKSLIICLYATEVVNLYFLFINLLDFGNLKLIFWDFKKINLKSVPVIEKYHTNKEASLLLNSYWKSCLCYSFPARF